MPSLPLVVLPLLLLAACTSASRGDRAWERGDLPTAVKAYARAGELDLPQRQRYARALAGMGDLEGARSQVSAIAAADLTEDGWMASGLVALSEGRLEDAVVAFSSGAALGKDPALAVNHCAALILVGRPDAALCTEALLLAPEDPQALLGVAAASLAERNRLVARRALNNLQSLKGATRDHLVEAARLYRIMGDDSDACALRLRVGAVRSPEEALETGRSCGAAGRWDEAHRLLDPLVADAPEASFILGTMALERALKGGDAAEVERWIADATRRMEACRDTYAGNASWHNNVGRIRALDGDLLGAEVAFRDALALEPDHPQAILNLSRLLKRSGHLEEACALSRRLWGARGDYRLLAGLDLANWSRERGDRQEARVVGEALLSLCQDGDIQPCIVAAALGLAVLEAEEGRTDAALDRLEQAVTAGGDPAREQARAEPALASLSENLRFGRIMDPTFDGGGDTPVDLSGAGSVGPEGRE